MEAMIADSWNSACRSSGGSAFSLDSPALGPPAFPSAALPETRRPGRPQPFPHQVRIRPRERREHPACRRVAADRVVRRVLPVPGDGRTRSMRSTGSRMTRAGTTSCTNSPSVSRSMPGAPMWPPVARSRRIKSKRTFGSYSAARREPTGPLVGDRNRAPRGHRALHWAHVAGLRRAHGRPPARAERTAE